MKHSAPIWKEDEQSQIPALQLLISLGYKYLSPEELTNARLKKESNVLLEEILDTQLRKLNKINYKGESFEFSDSNIRQSIQAIKDIPYDGLVRSNQKIYDLLTLGKSPEQIVAGDRKSFSLHYFDFENIHNNVFHVAEEFSVSRTNSQETYRPDIILFVNGIPLVVIECKRSDIKDPLDQALSQMMRNQQDDGIPKLFIYSQILLILARNSALYATAGTKPKFWASWCEENDNNTHLDKIINRPLCKEENDKLFLDRVYARDYFDQIEKEKRLVCEQDRLIYSLCRPERLMEIFDRFIVFKEPEKIIARYQQYFAIKKIMDRVTHLQAGKRTGGVIWHTQGSGKSLTMVMLAKSIDMESTIKNPRIIVVTDRVELDTQIKTEFEKCGYAVARADTGKELTNILAQEKATIITTIINKFDAVLRSDYKNQSSEIFVLIDESHRTQYGTFNTNMMRVFPNACFLAFTGTPLMSKDKNTAKKFGGLIDEYSINQAVKDKAVVPLLYEGRLVFQDVNKKAIDTWFDRISERLSPEQQRDLKKKFSSSDQLNTAEQKIKLIAYDVSDHFAHNPDFTGMKGQLTAPTKAAALKYKKYFDEYGLVTTEVLISPPDMREGFEDNEETQASDDVQAFWQKMMKRFGSPEKYDDSLRSSFKHSDDPQIIIVVDKLLTGFDAPKNTVLYLCRSLKEHTLLQAIARVNRLYEGKEFGYIIDYYGVLGKLNDALDMYSSDAFKDFDKSDLEGTLSDVAQEIKKLPQRHSDLLNIFTPIKNKLDTEEYEQLLDDEALRVKFKNALSVFVRTFSLALSTVSFMEETPKESIQLYKKDIASFENLRLSVIQRYAEVINYKEYEPKIKKLIDTYVNSDEVSTTVELVNIFDKDKFEQTVANTKGDRAKAETILNRTKKTISEKMAEDPAFYEKFSKLLEEAIKAYQEKRMSDADYLKEARKIMESVRNRSGDDIPSTLRSNDVARAFYGITLEVLKDKKIETTKLSDLSVEIALKIDEIIQSKLQVDWVIKSTVRNMMKSAIDDYLYKITETNGISLSYDELGQVIDRSIDIAKHRYQR